jgi:hypothetical protein
MQIAEARSSGQKSALLAAPERSIGASHDRDRAAQIDGSRALAIARPTLMMSGHAMSPCQRQLRMIDLRRSVVG